MFRSFIVLVCAVGSLFSFVACSGSFTSQPRPGTSVSLSPNTANLLVGTGMTFTATVKDQPGSAVTFSVAEGATGGQISASGTYLAPKRAGVYHVRANSVTNPSDFGEALVNVRDYANTISRTADPATGYDHHTASLLRDGSVLLVGGWGLNGQVNERTERYIPVENRFAPAAWLITERMAHSAVTLADGKILIAGGVDPMLPGTEFDPVFKSSELYDQATDAFVAGPDMNFPRRHHVATLLKDGRVLVTGGIQLRGSGFGASPNTEIYDPAANHFATTGQMNVGRWLHTATELHDGRVLIVGGRDNNCTIYCPVYSLRSAEIFDPATGTFTPTGSLNIGRYGHTATLLEDGRVLIIGGESTEELGTGTDQVAATEIYSPATGTFTRWTNLVLARGLHSATVLNNGKILLAGGFRISGMVTNRTEIFDPATGGSAEGPQMVEQHARHTATRLDNGEVFILGGNNGGQAVPVGERFR